MDEFPHSSEGPENDADPRVADTAAALRKRLLALTYQCPKDCYTLRCPFKILGGLSHVSREVILSRLGERELIALFELDPFCSCPADPRLRNSAP